MTEAERLAATLESDANDHRAIAQSVDGKPEHTANWQHMLTAEEAAAELRRLDKLCAEWETKAATWLASPEAAQRLEGYRELAQQVNRLEAECEQLRADAARYRWLRTFPNNISRAVYGATMVCDSGLLMRDTYLDEAIDAAMKETK